MCRGQPLIPKSFTLLYLSSLESIAHEVSSGGYCLPARGVDEFWCNFGLEWHNRGCVTIGENSDWRLETWSTGSIQLFGEFQWHLEDIWHNRGCVKMWDFDLWLLKTCWTDTGDSLDKFWWLSETWWHNRGCVIQVMICSWKLSFWFGGPPGHFLWRHLPI